MRHTDRTTAGRRRDRAVAVGAALVAMLFLGACGVEAVDDASVAADQATSVPDDGGDPTTSQPDDDAPADDQADEPTDDTTSDDDDDETTGTSSDSEVGSQDEMIRDALIQGFESAGLTNEQATCLADGYIEMGITDPNATGSELDITAMMDMITQCGISMEDLAGLGAGAGT